MSNVLAWQLRAITIVASTEVLLSITSRSQSRSEGIVARRHSRDFRMWCTVRSGWLPGAPEMLMGRTH